MVAAIILSLAVLTVGAIVCVFVVAVDELNKIDHISEHSTHSG